MGAENYSTIARFNVLPAAGIGKLATGANALDTATAVRIAALADMEPFFPSGLEVVYPYDTTTPFVKISIFEVVKTLVEAIMLVFVVMYLFLQNFRATLIPTVLCHQYY